ncbi:MAG: YvcK family protein [Bacilli bacterium]|nr:YvcK family protein [Bacilli bacterium]
MNNKKVVVLGGGTGMSVLLSGLKEFPLDISAIVSVSDDGSSTGKLREEFNVPAVGDIRKILVSLSNSSPLLEELLNYRFKTYSDLNNHAVGNLLLTALCDIKGNMSDAIEGLEGILDLKGKVIPLTEDNVTLVANMKDGSVIEGESEITEAKKVIEKIYYKEEPLVNEAAIKAIDEADLIILSMGSIYTSVIPNLICPAIINAIDKSNAKIMYICNMMTQPGETDNFKVSDHVKLLNSYLGKRKIDVVVANNKSIKKSVLKKYETLEQKDEVLVDSENLKDVKLILSNFFIIKDELIRHDALKLALNIFVYIATYVK